MSAKKRLLVVSHGFPPYYGGAEHVAGHLAHTAAASGRWEVQVLTSDIGGRLSAREHWEGCEVLRVHTRKKKWAGHTLPELLSFLSAARCFQPSVRPDFILANCALPAGEVACRLSQRLGVAYGVVLHGSDVPGHQKARFGWIYHLIRPWVRRIWRQAAWVSAVSEPLRKLALETWPEGMVHLIPNGVDIERFHPQEAPVERTEDGLFHLVTMAQLIPMKGLQHLLQAMARLPDPSRERLRWTVYGTGPYEEELRRLAAQANIGEQVSFAGLLESSELAARLREADAFALPSLREGLPLSLLEAMASGLPVMISAIGGIPDVVRTDENGLLTPPEDERALQEALLRLMKDASLRKRLGTAARKTALDWSWKKIWAHYEALLASALEGGSS
ncbi:MAG: glycosyltransferase [Verrucomicrobiota bacterium]|jgi:glycosyltransferase involved in cell wall biosynthesis|nr:glycosyltransferase [Verrucomicrobiota bacterium]